MSEFRATASGLALLLCLVVTSGCGDGGSPSCERDDALLAERRACVLDEDCPCGAYCDLGQCGYDCLTDHECASGDWCDSFGRCRASDDRGVIGLASPSDRAVIVLDRADLVFPPGFTEQSVWMSVRHRDAGRVRVAARDEGVLVRCGAEGDFGSECTFEGLDPAGGPYPIRVKLASATVPTEELRHEVAVFGEGGYRYVFGVRVEPEDGPARVGTAGLYRGYLRPVGGPSSRLDASWRALRIPVTVELFAAVSGSHTITLEDDYGLLPQGLVGTLGETDGALAVPAMHYLGPVAPTATDIDVDVALSATALATTATTIDGELRTTFLGATLPEHALVMRWQLSATRVGDASGDVPGVPDSVGPDRDAVVARANVSLPAELSAEAAAFPDLGVAASSIVEALLCTEAGDAAAVRLRPEVLDLDDTVAERLAASADLACEDQGTRGRGQLVFPLLAATAPRSAVDVVTDCITDLGGGLATGAFGSEGCVDEGRLLAAVAIGVGPDRELALGGPGSGERVASTFAHRLLQQWVALHGAIAREGMQVENLQAILGLGDGAPPASIGLSSLDLSMAGSDLLLHPRIGVGLAEMNDRVLAAPDYRALRFPTDPLPSYESDQPVGLSAALLDMVRAQAVSLNDSVTHARFGRIGSSEVDARLSELLRRALVMAALGERLHSATVTELGGEEPDWEPEWVTAQVGSAAALRSLFGQLEELRDGSNPLGIDDRDLPLYRVGDEVLAGSRITALSDYLLGTGAEPNPIVPTMIARAETTLAAARDAWVSNLQREYTQELVDNDRSRRLEGLHRRYGEQIIAICGDPAWSSDTVLDTIQSLSENPRYALRDCYVTDAPGCGPPPSTGFADIRDREVGHYLCMASELRKSFGDSFSTGDEELDDVVERINEAWTDDEDPTPVITADHRLDVRCTGFGRVGPSEHPEQCRAEPCLQCQVAGESLTLPDPGSAAFDYPDCSGLAEDGCHTNADCGDGWACVRDPDGFAIALCPGCPFERSRVCRKFCTVDVYECGSDEYCVDNYCSKREPGCGSDAVARASQICDAAAAATEQSARFGGAAENPACYQGSLGELALSVRVAAREVEAARQEAQELTERYDIAMRSCYIAEEGHWAIDDAIAAHNGVMTALGALKLAADVVVNVAGSSKDCMGAVNKASSPWGAVAAGGECAASFVEGAAKSVSNGLQFSMDVVERDHQLAMQRFEHDIENRVCFNEAEMHLVGVRTQSVRMQQAMLDLARQMVAFENLQVSVEGLYAEGLAAVQNETERRVSPLNTDFWLDEEVQRYHDAFRQAQRVAYLAAVAVEYELQLTTTERYDILAARTPEELRGATTRLAQHTATGQVSGASPNNDFAVISLREELLRLTSHASAPYGWKKLKERERLGAWLNDEARMVRDAEGRVLGREISFTLQPLGVLGIGGPAGVDILAGRDCAERLWSVNASILAAAGERLSHRDTTIARIVLRKRNTFASQWCVAPDDGTGFQQASVRPTRNLFLDPYARPDTSSGAPAGAAVDPAEENGFVDARISAYYDVSRAELEDERYFNGDSQELAGRGLYGDYALFFPEEILGDGTAAHPGLNLANIDDVLLRFDYVSVARRR